MVFICGNSGGESKGPGIRKSLPTGPKLYLRSYQIKERLTENSLPVLNAVKRSMSFLRLPIQMVR